MATLTEELAEEELIWEEVPGYAVHKFDPDSQPAGYDPLPEGFIAYAVRDRDAPNPRTDYDHLGRFHFGGGWSGYSIDECEHLHRIVNHFSGHRDREVYIERACRLLLDAAAVRSFSHYDTTVWAYIDRRTAARVLLAPPSNTREDVETYLSTDVEEPARQALDAEIREYQTWAEGNVYGVVVQHVASGREEALWGCYDDEAWKYFPYLRQVVDDLLTQF